MRMEIDMVYLEIGMVMRIATWEWEGIGVNGNKKIIKLSRRLLHCAVLSCGQLTKSQAVRWRELRYSDHYTVCLKLQLCCVQFVHVVHDKDRLSFELRSMRCRKFYGKQRELDFKK